MLKLAAATAIFVLAAVPASAQRTTFNPSLALGSLYSDNVDYLDVPGDDSGDTVTRARLVLPLVRRQDQGAVQLSYEIGRNTYTKENQNDNTEQSATFRFDRTTRRRSTWTVTSRYLKTQEQRAFSTLPTEITPGEIEGPDDVDLSLTERIERRSISAEIGYDLSAGRRWTMGASFAAGQSDFGGGTTVEDRVQYGPTLRVRSSVTERTSLEVGYRFLRAELDRSGNEDFHTIDLSVDYDMSRKVGLGVRLGGFVREPDASESESGVFGGVDIRFNNGLTFGPVRFDLTARGTPSGGGARTGTAFDSTVGVVISGVRTYPLNWRFGTFYNHRNPFDSNLSTTKTFSVDAGVEPAISRILSLRFSAGYADQEGDDLTQSGSYARAAVNLVIYPLGKKRIAGRVRSSVAQEP